jgi:transposase
MLRIGSRRYSRSSSSSALASFRSLALRLTHIPTGVKDDVFFRAHEGARGVAMRNSRDHDRHARASDQRLERITGSKRRRARSARGKAAIVAEAFAPGANVAKIRRHHGLLFSRRRQVRRARPSPVADATSEEGRDPAFVPVEIEGPVGNPAGPTVSHAPSPTPRVPVPMIEIVMPAGTVRVPTGVDAATLATVMATLRALA